MNVETIPHAMYFSHSKETIAKINQVPYQIIEYDNEGMFQVKLMDNTHIQIFLTMEHIIYPLMEHICRAMTRRPPFPMNYVSWFPSELRGKNSAIDRVTVLESIIRVRESNTTLLSRHKVLANQKLSHHLEWDGLSQSETFLPLNPVRSNIITPRHLKRGARAPWGPVLKFHN